MSVGYWVKRAIGGAVSGALWGLLIGTGIGLVAVGFIQPIANAVSGELTQWAVNIGNAVAAGITEDIGKGLGQAATGACLGAVCGLALGSLWGSFHRLYYGDL